MMPQKRPMLFLKKAEEIYQKLTHARFLWVGDGPMSDEWDAWVRARGLEGVIRRLPWQHDVQSLLFAADVFMHTAEYEGLPLAILEAMSAGLPLAMTPNLLEEMPFLSRSSPVMLNGAALDTATLSNAAELQSRGAQGRELIREQFSFDKMAEGYEVLYKTLAASRRNGGAPKEQ
jgi:glycosyltransferase involved in cell wall biosynthesis